MSTEHIFEWLWIVNCFGCGNHRIWDFVSCFADISEAYETILNSDKRRKFLTDAEDKSAGRVAEEQVNEVITYCKKHNIYIMTYDDEIYPERIRSIYNPPAVLFCRGDMGCLENEFSLSVVGTRKPSDYSVKVTEALVRSLAELGVTIVSGFAVGIDIAANLSAIKGGGKTIAVLGCGLDYDYPRENSAYRKDIEANGLFISEYFPKATGSLQTFPARNRILTALSLGTIVIEAGKKSGALVSANLALGQGRDVFAVAPHNLFDTRYGGNVSLIRDGAICLCGLNDILYEYYENYGHKIANAARRSGIAVPNADPGASDTVRKTSKKAVRSADNAADKTDDKEDFDASVLEGDTAQVYAFLKESGKPMLADELAAEFDMDIAEMLMILTDLELEGAVSAAAGHSYAAN